MWENTHMQALFCLVPRRWLAANADLVKTALTGGAIGVANTPGEATVTKTLTKQISVSLASFEQFSLAMSASVLSHLWK